MPVQDDIVNAVYNDCRITPAEPWFESSLLYDDMRTQDMLECIGLGHHPRLAIEQSYKVSEQAWTITTLDRRMIASFGVGKSSKPNEGVIWLLGTHRMHLIRKTFVKHSKEWVNKLMGDYDVLTNLVMTSNELSMRWLTWLGASWTDVDIDGYKQFSIYNNNKS